jgi:hypothetical protein
MRPRILPPEIEAVVSPLLLLFLCPSPFAQDANNIEINKADVKNFVICRLLVWHSHTGTRPGSMMN